MTSPTFRPFPSFVRPEKICERKCRHLTFPVVPPKHLQATAIKSELKQHNLCDDFSLHEQYCLAVTELKSVISKNMGLLHTKKVSWENVMTFHLTFNVEYKEWNFTYLFIYFLTKRLRVWYSCPGNLCCSKLVTSPPFLPGHIDILIINFIRKNLFCGKEIQRWLITVWNISSTKLQRKNTSSDYFFKCHLVFPK